MTLEKLDQLQQLNQLALNDAEQADMLKIFEYMAGAEGVLGDFDTENVEVMVHVLPMTNILREDGRKQPFSRDDLLKSAPEHTEDSWQVPRLVK